MQWGTRPNRAFIAGDVDGSDCDCRSTVSRGALERDVGLLQPKFSAIMDFYLCTIEQELNSE